MSIILSPLEVALKTHKARMISNNSKEKSFGLPNSYNATWLGLRKGEHNMVYNSIITYYYYWIETGIEI